MVSSSRLGEPGSTWVGGAASAPAFPRVGDSMVLDSVTGRENLSVENGAVPGQAIALVDGEHHPAAVREALDRLDAERGVAGGGLLRRGGEARPRLPR